MTGDNILPKWFLDLKPDRITDTGESLCCEWFNGNILLDVYDDREVVAIAPCEDDKRGYCAVTLDWEEWIKNFVKYGWSDENPSFKK